MFLKFYTWKLKYKTFPIKPTVITITFWNRKTTFRLKFKKFNKQKNTAIVQCKQINFI